MSLDVAIIDSGGANLASLQFALERLGARSIVTSDAGEIAAAPRVILPGVGSALAAMQRLNAAGVAAQLPQLKQPLLGICLGMQLLFLKSEEGPAQCLGILPQTVRRLEPKQGRPVPHMGWNRLHIAHPDPLLEGVAEHEHLYFVHSYAAPVSATTLATCSYGVEIAAVVRKGNFWGTQFHPERSTKVGARILANFLRLA
ncbi:MAG TPA: imidazole glycerol phosphate synthase subunit HisH [Steroidobacteraceae bacterium]|nr:imidazole glycerol phosphate synthase subunit HisH [Steroidobacteraceae bacterium]